MTALVTSLTWTTAAAMLTTSAVLSALGNTTVDNKNNNNSSDNNNSVTHSNSDPTGHGMDDNGEFFDRWETYSSIGSVAVPVVFGVIFVVGLVGNGTLIVSVLANKEMRNVPNILIVSLSLGDFLLILVSVPVTSFLYTFIHWPFGTVMCKLNEYIQTLSLGVSVFTLTALSADRYVAIVQPMAKLTCCSRRATVGVALAIWLLSAVLAVPDAVLSTEKTSENITACWLYPSEQMGLYPKIFHTAKLIVFFILPVLTIGFFYVMMARMLIRSSKSVPTESKTGLANQQRQIAARKKVARVVLSFVVIFVICWLPRHIFIMWYWFNTDLYNQFWHTFKITAFCLQFINSCVNPFALYFLSRQFRMYYNRYLFCCCRGVWYSSLEPSSTMHNLHGTTRRTSPTTTSLVHSQSMC